MPDKTDRKPRVFSWNDLITKERFFTSGTAPRTDDGDESLHTHQRDHDRILYSSAFRRLQAKTQVHPFPSLDYVRTRLTHSLEVASVGRYLGVAVARRLFRDYPDEAQAIKDKRIDESDIGEIVAAAGLAHDLGNPPFGHIGEEAIRSWFRSALTSKPRVAAAIAEEAKRNDFLFFDGNAQGFRIISRLQGWRQEGGLQLTYSTLGTFAKYPFSSAHSNEAKKKFGFFQADRVNAKTIFSVLKLDSPERDRYFRHPLSFLLEAADDISYLTTDIEDAAKAKVLDFATAKELLLCIAERGGFMRDQRFKQIGNNADRISYLRAGAISALIEEAIQAFFSHYDGIMTGSFNKNLLEIGKYRAEVTAIREAAKREIYIERAKMETEAGGFHAINFLLDQFADMIFDYSDRSGDVGKMLEKNQAIYALLPIEDRPFIPTEHYDALLYVVDYVSGMTDRYAARIFKKISGADIGEGNLH